MTYPITDVIDLELNVDDFVVFYSNIYKIKAVGTTKHSNGGGMVRMKIVDNPDAKTVVKHSKAIAKLDQQQVLFWMLKKGYQ
jgi:translation elongation factor P/translation initiation factor 5A